MFIDVPPAGRYLLTGERGTKFQTLYMLSLKSNGDVRAPPIRDR
jgi:hypothetical protein